MPPLLLASPELSRGARRIWFNWWTAARRSITPISPFSNGRQLLVNADDFGLSPGVNRGILEAHHAGLVTSTSIMANLPAADDGAALVGTAPRLEVGVHLNLTAGAPLSPAVEIPSLVRENGSFCILGEL